MSEPKHWLVKHAEEMPLSKSVFQNDTKQIADMMTGALRYVVKNGGKKQLSELKRIIKAHEVAEQVLAARVKAKS